MDGNSNKRPVDPAVALRLRYLELEELAKAGKTKCDRCEKTVTRGNAIESWKGNSCVYVACLGCLGEVGILFVVHPNGLHVIPQEEAATGTVRGVSSLLPSSNRPLQRGESQVVLPHNRPNGRG